VYTLHTLKGSVGVFNLHKLRLKKGKQMPNITNRRQAIQRLIDLSKLIEKDMYFHPFKYEIEGLINDFEVTEKRIKSSQLKEIYFCIGFLRSDKSYKNLEINDLAI
jgi:hypothetical protein